MVEALKAAPFFSLEKESRAIKEQRIQTLFDQDSNRAEGFSLQAGGVFLDYSKNLVTSESLLALVALAKDSQVPESIQALFDGDEVNTSEGRTARHMHLRLPKEGLKDPFSQKIHQTREKMAEVCQALHTGDWKGCTGKKIKDVIAIGVGGSYLGPQSVITALRPYWREEIRVQYLVNIDARELSDRLTSCDPETTLVIIASKSFRTHETLLNAQSVKNWLEQGVGSWQGVQQHFVALTANRDAAEAFGIDSESILPLWDSVGGRFSLWSSIGLPIAIQIGWENFEALLAGAHEMDRHFNTQPLEVNMPVIMALLNFWYQAFWGAKSQAVLPYAYDLRHLPGHLQQLSMESLGKRVDCKGQPLTTETGALVWGGIGVNGQHAYHQLLHQGTHCIPIDFILPARSLAKNDEYQEWLVANCLSQSRTLMTGQSYEEACEQLKLSGYSDKLARETAKHLAMPGNRPSNTVILEDLSPKNLGALIALYEHKVYVESLLYQVNCFDQWGVELGKNMAKKLHECLKDEKKMDSSLDASTKQLIMHCKEQGL